MMLCQYFLGLNQKVCCDCGRYRGRKHEPDRPHDCADDFCCEYLAVEQETYRIGAESIEEQEERQRSADIGNGERVDQSADVFAPDAQRTAIYFTARKMRAGSGKLLNGYRLPYRRIVENSERAYQNAADEQTGEIYRAARIEI